MANAAQRIAAEEYKNVLKGLSADAKTSDECCVREILVKMSIMALWQAKYDKSYEEACTRIKTGFNFMFYNPAQVEKAEALIKEMPDDELNAIIHDVICIWDEGEYWWKKMSKDDRTQSVFLGWYQERVGTPGCDHMITI